MINGRQQTPRLLKIFFLKMKKALQLTVRPQQRWLPQEEQFPQGAIWAQRKLDFNWRV